MRSAVFALLAAAVPATASPDAIAGEAPRAVVELFTSQGCSSCPPADRFLGELAKRDDIIALTFPVDYWDYLGWRDTFASPANSQRQGEYAEARGDRAVYTPQMVVNGAAHVVGSDRRALARVLDAAAPLPARVILRRQGDVVEISVEGELPAGVRMAAVSLVSVAAPAEVAIGRGENRGRSVIYTNVVRAFHAVGMWDGGKAVFRLPVSEIKKTRSAGCAAIVQEERGGRPGRILGAGRL